MAGKIVSSSQSRGTREQSELSTQDPNFPPITPFLWLISNLIALWSEKMFYMVSVFLSTLKFALWPSMWSVLENVSCAHKNVYFAAFGCVH